MNFFKKKNRQPDASQTMDELRNILQELELELVAAETELEFMENEEVPASSTEAYELGGVHGGQAVGVEYLRMLVPFFQNLLKGVEEAQKMR